MNWLNSLRVCGEHSIVIYLAFFLPMAATRTLLLHAGLIRDIGTISLLVTIVGVLGALAMWRMALAVGANFLFERRPRSGSRRKSRGGRRCRRRRKQPLQNRWCGSRRLLLRRAKAKKRLAKAVNRRKNP